MGPTCRPYLPLLALHLPLHYPGLSLSCPCLPCYTGTQDLSHLSPLPYIYLYITLVYHCLAPVFPAILVPKILVISPPCPTFTSTLPWSIIVLPLSSLLYWYSTYPTPS